MNFEELRSFICKSNRGRVFDSLIAVELGLKDYQCAWDAHCDMNPHGNENDIIAAFLIDVAEHIGIIEDDFDKVLANVE